MAGDYETADRLLELLADVDAGRPLRIRDIEGRFEVERATATKYLRWLKKHRPLVEEREGTLKVWRLSPPEDASEDALARAAAVAFAVQALGELKGTDLHRHLEDLAEQNRLALPDGPQQKLARMARGFRVRVAHKTRRASDREKWLPLLLRAMEQRRVCDVTYMNRIGERARYTIEPWGLLLHHDRLYLVAGKRGEGLRRAKRRFFAVDGFTHVEVDEAGMRFSVPPDRQTDYAEVFENYIGIYCELERPVEDVRLLVRKEPAVLLAQRQVHPSQQLFERDDEWTEVRLRVVVCPELRAFVLGLLPDVRILGPETLRDEVRGALEGMEDVFESNP